MAKAIQTATSLPVVPRELQGILYGPQGAFTQFAEAQASLPSLSQLGQGSPGLNVINLTPEERQYLNQAISTLSSPDAFQQAAQSVLSMLTGGQVGQGPVVQSAIDAFTQHTLPLLQQNMALGGRSASGAMQAAISRGIASMMPQLVQRDIDNRLRAATALPSLAGQQAMFLTTAAQLAGAPREIAQKQAEEAYKQALRNWQTQLNLQQYPLGLLSGLIGAHQRGTAYQTKTAEDWVGAGLQIGGTLLSAL